MNPTTLRKFAFAAVILGALLMFLGGRSEPEPPPAPTPTPTPEAAPAPEATPETEPVVVEAPQPAVDPRTRALREGFSAAVIASATAGAPNPDARRLLGELTASGLGAVPLLTEELTRSTEGLTTLRARNTIVYRLLADDGSDGARALLFEHANKPPVEAATLGPAAANAWLSGAADTTAMIPLLKSEQPLVQEATVLAMTGKALTPEAIAALEPRLAAGSFTLRTLAVQAYAADPSPAGAIAKLTALGKASIRAGGLQGGNDKHPETGISYGEMTYGSYLDAVLSMPGGMEAAKDVPQVSMILMVRARGGDASVLNDLRTVVRRARGYRRLLALESVADLLTLEDASLLIQMSGDDWKVAPSHPPGRDASYPISDLASELLMNLE